MESLSIYQSRLKMGDFLAEKILKIWKDNDIDVVIPVPDTSEQQRSGWPTIWV